MYYLNYFGYPRHNSSRLVPVFRTRTYSLYWRSAFYNYASL